MYCDASRVGLGCVLMQHVKVVADYSRKLKVHDRNYLNYDLKLAAVLFALKIWRHYLYCVHVDVYTNILWFHGILNTFSLSLVCPKLFLYFM